MFASFSPTFPPNDADTPAGSVKQTDVTLAHHRAYPVPIPMVGDQVQDTHRERARNKQLVFKHQRNARAPNEGLGARVMTILGGRPLGCILRFGDNDPASLTRRRTGKCFSTARARFEFERVLDLEPALGEAGSEVAGGVPVVFPTLACMDA